MPASVQDLRAVQRRLEVGGALAVVDMSVDDSDRESQARMSGNRYAVLSDDAEESERHSPVARPRLRLLLVSQNPDPVASDHDWDPDTVLETPILAEARIHALSEPLGHVQSPPPVGDSRGLAGDCGRVGGE